METPNAPPIEAFAMATPASSPDIAASRRQRVRIILTLTVVIAVACVFGYLTWAMNSVNQMDRRILAGDFPNIRLERVTMAVADDGKIFADGLKGDLYVASLRVVPPGKYRAMLVANDGNPEHIAKAELVIAAQDEKGAWYPKTAPQILERLNSPKPSRSAM
jgi:hypothetical protein